MKSIVTGTTTVTLNNTDITNITNIVNIITIMFTINITLAGLAEHSKLRLHLPVAPRRVRLPRRSLLRVNIAHMGMSL